MNRWKIIKRIAYAGSALCGGALMLWFGPKYYTIRDDFPRSALHAQDAVGAPNHCTRPLPSRSKQLSQIKNQEYDILVIGGGATGCGVALDAISRGLKVAMIEKYDFSSGTSSRSTKLIHGGVRYLQKAILGLDLEQYRMVKEALTERANLIEVAPHLAYPFPIMLPVYRWWQVPYFWVGIKAYDLVAGRQILKPSYFLSKSKALELFPMLKKDKLVGALVYYDGQHNDARMCISLALTAARMGANIANYVSAEKLTKSEHGKVNGAVALDRIEGKEFQIRAKCVINATGPHTDFIRTKDNPLTQKICQPSSGVHVVLPDYYSPANMGLLDPSTSDGRIIFFLPWENNTMAGTTDVQCRVTDYPSPTEDEIQFILGEIRNYLNPDINVRRGDVLSAWSGIRPLVINPSAKDTQSIARNHIIEVSDTGLVTIAGGKWTTYRHMAEETVDRAVAVSDLKPQRSCCTKHLMLDGADEWSPTLFIRLIQDFGLDSNVALHLSNTYGDKAFEVARAAGRTGKRWPIVGRRLHEDFPYIEAEVVHAVKEYACTVIDILARRTRLAFLNVHAAQEALPLIVEIMARELKWSKQRQDQETKRALRFLNREMGLGLKISQEIPVSFSEREKTELIKSFDSMDQDNKGYITVSDLEAFFKKTGEDITLDEIHDILSEVDLNKNGEVDVNEFLVVHNLMNAQKTGSVPPNRFAQAVEQNAEMTKRISIARSGGGL